MCAHTPRTPRTRAGARARLARRLRSGARTVWAACELGTAVARTAAIAAVQSSMVLTKSPSLRWHAARLDRHWQRKRTPPVGARGGLRSARNSPSSSSAPPVDLKLPSAVSSKSELPADLKLLPPAPSPTAVSEGLAVSSSPALPAAVVELSEAGAAPASPTSALGTAFGLDKAIHSEVASALSARLYRATASSSCPPANALSAASFHCAAVRVLCSAAAAVAPSSPKSVQSPSLPPLEASWP
jgi:hypothetical protein